MIWSNILAHEGSLSTSVVRLRLVWHGLFPSWLYQPNYYCHPGNLSGEVCCLPGAHIHDITKRLPGLVRPEVYHPFLFLHIGSNEAWNKEAPKYQMGLYVPQKDVERIGSASSCSPLSSQLETGTQEEGDKWIKWIIGCVAGTMLKVLGSVISDTLQRDQACWHWMGHT